MYENLKNKGNNLIILSQIELLLRKNNISLYHYLQKL